MKIAQKVKIDFTGSSVSGQNIIGDGCISPFIPFVNQSSPGNTNFAIDLVGHSASPSLKLWDATAAAARGEVNLSNMETSVGNENYVSIWFFLPSDWVVPKEAVWYSIADPMQKSDDPWLPYVEIWIHQPNPPGFRVTIGGRQTNDFQCVYKNKDGTLGIKDFTASQFPRGRWFNIKWWTRRNPTLGESFIKVWFDGVQIVDQTAFPYESGPLNYVRQEKTKNSLDWTEGTDYLTDLDYPNEYFTTVAKVYHGDTSYIHQLWVDDVEIWDANPGPMPLTADADGPYSVSIDNSTIQFVGRASGGSDNYTWDWDFGDESPHSSSQNPSHTYLVTTPSNFFVSLTVTDVSTNEVATASATVTITPPTPQFPAWLIALPIIGGVIYFLWKNK